MGGESGPDLTRAASVATDVRGDKIGPSCAPVASIKACRRSSRSTRRISRPWSPSFSRPEDQGGVVDGNAAARRRCRGSPDGQRRGGGEIFRGACREVPLGDRRLRGPRQAAARGSTCCKRMLFPTQAAERPCPRAKVTVTTPVRREHRGHVGHRDRVHDCARGRVRRATAPFATNQVKFTVDDPLQAHVEQLRKVHRCRYAQRSGVSADAPVEAVSIKNVALSGPRRG